MSNTDIHILYRVRLRSDHKRSGKTSHTIEGIVADPPFELRIMQFSGDPGFYLVHLDKNEQEITDTYHESCGLAMAQAEYEFGIKTEDWQ